MRWAGDDEPAAPVPVAALPVAPPVTTDIDDLTDEGVASYLFDLAGIFFGEDRDQARQTLGKIVRHFDRAAADWPSTVLGLAL